MSAGGLVIKGGVVVTAELSRRADVRIEGERIAEIGADLTGDRVLDADGALVIPGGIDPHTHFDVPHDGVAAVETFYTGTCSALAGGSTTVVDMCIPAQGQSLLEAFDLWESRARAKACCDYSYHMTVVEWSERTREEMAEVVRRGVPSFKHFMAYKGDVMLDDAALYASFRRCAALGALPLVHAENGDAIDARQAELVAAGRTEPYAHALSRPPEVEAEAANRAIMLAELAGTPLYIVHVSCEPAHAAIRRGRERGLRIYGEPLPQHLVLDESEYLNPDWEHAACRVMSPPFRDKRHQDSLWAGLAAGSLQVTASDHCGYTRAQKRRGKGDFTKIPNGVGGVEERLAILWTYGVETGRLTQEEFVAVTSTNIARLLNMHPRKGSITPGADADLVVWDPKAGKTISAETHRSALDFNVFEGIKVSATPRFVLSRGALVHSALTPVEPAPGRGRFIERRPAAARGMR